MSITDFISAQGDLKELYVKTDLPVDQQETRSTCTICATNFVLHKIAVCLCRACNAYLCDECVRNHDKNHDLVDAKSDMKVRKNQSIIFLDNVRRDPSYSKYFTRENVKVCGRLNVKYAFDEVDCDINAFCGLANNQWVALDINNFSIKMYDFVTNLLNRCVGFRFKPWGVTEIKTKNPRESNSIELSEILPINQRQETSQLLAVSFPHIKQIWLIDLERRPAVKSQIVQMNKKCYHIDFTAGKIVALCREDDRPNCNTIYALDTDGNTLYEFPSSSPSYISSIAVNRELLYLTCSNDKKVLCVDQAGSIQKEISFEGLEPLGISVDPGKNVYVSGGGKDRLYRLDLDLNIHESIEITQNTRSNLSKYSSSKINYI